MACDTHTTHDVRRQKWHVIHISYTNQYESLQKNVGAISKVRVYVWSPGKISVKSRPQTVASVPAAAGSVFMRRLKLFLAKGKKLTAACMYNMKNVFKFSLTRFAIHIRTIISEKVFCLCTSFSPRTSGSRPTSRRLPAAVLRQVLRLFDFSSSCDDPGGHKI